MRGPPLLRIGEFDAVSCQLGQGIEIILPCNIYRCTIGDDCRIGPFVEIQEGCIIGKRVKIASHTFICAGTVIGDDVFIGHGVMTCNDRFPRGTVDGRLKEKEDWRLDPIRICDGASIGSGAIILPGIEIGYGSMIGAGSVVTKAVKSKYIAFGNPAKVIRRCPDL